MKWNHEIGRKKVQAVFGFDMRRHARRFDGIRKGICMAFLLSGICMGGFGCGETAQEVMTRQSAEAEPSAAVEAPTGGETENAEAETESERETQRTAKSSISENEISEENGRDEAGKEVEIARPEPVKVRGIYVSGPVAGIRKMDELIELVDRTELNTMVIDVKNDEGKVTYKMQSDSVQELEASVGYISDIRGLVEKCKEKNIYLIARVVAFRDPYLVERKPEWAVHTKEGEVFRDKNGMAWVNPYEREIWDYLTEIALQAGEDGFDEVQFDYIRFSTDVREEEVDYGPEAEDADKIEIITEFTEYIYEKLAPQGVYVAADVFGTVIDNRTDQEIVGQDYAAMAASLDYICPMVYPSHYYSGAYGIAVPDADPYATIYAAASSSARKLEAVPREKRAHVRLWLQSFTASWVPGHIGYGPRQIREQIRGAYDAGYEEWILWNAAVNYQADSLLTPEEAEAERQRWDAKEPEPAENEAVQPEPAENEAVQPEPAESEAVQPEPAESEAVQPEPVENEAAQPEQQSE